MPQTDDATLAGAGVATGSPSIAAPLSREELALLAYLRIAGRLHVPRGATALVADARALVARGLAVRTPTSSPRSPLGETVVPTAAGLAGPPPELLPLEREAEEAEP